MALQADTIRGLHAKVRELEAESHFNAAERRERTMTKGAGSLRLWLLAATTSVFAECASVLWGQEIYSNPRKGGSSLSLRVTHPTNSVSKRTASLRRFGRTRRPAPQYLS